MCCMRGTHLGKSHGDLSIYLCKPITLKRSPWEKCFIFSELPILNYRFNTVLFSKITKTKVKGSFFALFVMFVLCPYKVCIKYLDKVCGKQLSRNNPFKHKKYAILITIT